MYLTLQRTSVTEFVVLCFAEATAMLDKIAKDKNVECPHPRTATRLLDKVGIP